MKYKIGSYGQVTEELKPLNEYIENDQKISSIILVSAFVTVGLFATVAGFIFGTFVGIGTEK